MYKEENLRVKLTKEQMQQPINGSWSNVTRDQVIQITSTQGEIVTYHWDNCPLKRYDYMTTKGQLLRCYKKINC